MGGWQRHHKDNSSLHRGQAGQLTQFFYRFIATFILNHSRFSAGQSGISNCKCWLEFFENFLEFLAKFLEFGVKYLEFFREFLEFIKKIKGYLQNTLKVKYTNLGLDELPNLSNYELLGEEKMDSSWRNIKYLKYLLEFFGKFA